MAEKITLKNALANLPQKTDVDSIVATDASGNPVYIKKSDLAQVVAELMPTATAKKNGLMSIEQYMLMPQELSIGKTFNAINLGTYEKRYMRFIALIFGYNPSSMVAQGYLLAFSSDASDSVKPDYNCTSFGTKSPAYKFLYKDNGNSYTVYFYCSDTYSGNHPIFIINPMKSVYTESINIDDSYKEISIVGD